MTYDLPNGSVWDLDMNWEIQEQSAKNWMEDAIDPTNYNSKKLEMNLNGRPPFYSKICYQDTFVILNDVRSVTDIYGN